MKIVFIALLFIVCIVSSGLNEKTFFAFNIYQSAQDGSPKSPLERTSAVLYGVKGGKTATSTVYEIAGGKSSVRIRSIEVLFKTTPDNISAKTDPATAIELFRLVVSKSKRSFSLTNDSKVGSVPILISFQPEDYLKYKIILFSNLVPGEYAFIDKTTAAADGKVTAFAFGID
jgi:hypothetical protein